ncbi:hypothetical protein G7046_g4880 [Stylonectria norvegica]|nr:hypothetical protein G7046_g4880 [Stylonectria norvegica]
MNTDSSKDIVLVTVIVVIDSELRGGSSLPEAPLERLGDDFQNTSRRIVDDVVLKTVLKMPGIENQSEGAEGVQHIEKDFEGALMDARAFRGHEDFRSEHTTATLRVELGPHVVTIFSTKAAYRVASLSIDVVIAAEHSTFPSSAACETVMIEAQEAHVKSNPRYINPRKKNPAVRKPIYHEGPALSQARCSAKGQVDAVVTDTVGGDG